jgi:hypothetical protein
MAGYASTDTTPAPTSAAAFEGSMTPSRGVHVLWLILVIPLLARMLARRRR